MFTKFFRIACLIAVTALVVGCSWKPDVEPSPITAPWSEMKLPVAENAVVFRSEPKEFRAAHKGEAQKAAEAYVETLKAQGWQMSDFNAGDEITATFKKDARTLTMRAYFFDGSSTAVVLEEQ